MIHAGKTVSGILFPQEKADTKSDKKRYDNYDKKSQSVNGNIHK